MEFETKMPPKRYLSEGASPNPFETYRFNSWGYKYQDHILPEGYCWTGFKITDEGRIMILGRTPAQLKEFARLEKENGEKKKQI